MTNENEKTPVEGMEQDYLETIKTLKETTVPMDDYNKLKQENKKLLNTILEGGELENMKEAAPKRTAAEIRTELFSESADNFTNLQFVEKALELREAVMDEGGIDPFVPQGQRIAPTDDDYEAAQRVADAFQSCIEVAQGDNSIFMRELDRITIDNAPMTVRNRNKGRR